MTSETTGYVDVYAVVEAGTVLDNITLSVQATDITANCKFAILFPATCSQRIH